MKNASHLRSAALIVAIAGTAAMAVPPVIDGKRGTNSPAFDSDAYGAAKWVNANPTGFGDNTALILNNAPLGDPQNVTKGIELAIPFAAIGYDGISPLKIAAFVASSNNGFLSNQVLGPLAANTENLAEPRQTNFQGIAGNQYVVVSPATVTTAPIVNGDRDSGYGTAFAVQTNGTGFGKMTRGTVDGSGTGNGGSELDALYCVQKDGVLYLFIAGNLESNGNKLNIFFDTDVTEGQNILAGNPQGVDRLSDNDGSGNGLGFDLAFAPDYWIGVNGSNIAATGQPANYKFFVDYVTLPTFGLGNFAYCGNNSYGAIDTALTGGDGGSPAIIASIDNSNLAGVVGGNSGTFTVRPNPDRAAGSELDALYARVEGDKLYIFVAGNLETNTNKFNLFFSVDGVAGQQRLRSAGDPTNNPGFRPNPDIAFGALQKMGTSGNAVDPLTATDGLKFDNGFEACYFLSINNSSAPSRVFLDGAVIRAGGRRQTPVLSPTVGGKALDYGCFDGGTKSQFPVISFNGPLADQQDSPPSGTKNNIYSNYSPRAIGDNVDATATTGSVFPWLNSNLSQAASGRLFCAIDNSNVAGITGAAADPVAAAAVSTGIEFAIALSELGITDLNNIPRIKVAGFINNTGFDFVSNQVIGGLPAGQGNLGGPRAIDFSSIAGDQFVVVYEPPVVALGCSPADIAYGDGEPLPPIGQPGGFNPEGPDGGDFDCFFNFYFAAAPDNAVCDIAYGDGEPLPPYGVPGGFNPGVDGGDFDCFFNYYFNGCL